MVKLLFMVQSLILWLRMQLVENGSLNNKVDYSLPERFKLEYTDRDNNKRPVMIHRAPSMERFVAVLIEHCAGNFPLWLYLTSV